MADNANYCPEFSEINEEIRAAWDRYALNLRSLEAEVARLKRREAELLEANNLYLERARAADRDIRFQRMQILHLTGAIGADALIAVVDDNARLRAKLAEIGARPRRRRWRPYV